MAAVDLFLRSVKDFKPQAISDYFPIAAQFLIDRNWQPARALNLLEQSKIAVESAWARDRDDDNLTDDEVKQRMRSQTQWELYLDGLTLKAAMEAERPAEALKLRASVETPPPNDTKLQSQYWWNRARLAAIQNHTQDALAYYQLALQTRTDMPRPLYGELRDDLRSEALDLWKAQGGSEVAWAVWSKPVTRSTDQLAQGRWEKPTEATPVFQITDLSGKAWRLADLQGKALLVNVWATWCGPCQEELPYLQKFYEKTKDRPDIQVLTFNIDENLGLVPPYLKEKGYTFPVLPVYSAGVLRDFAVPQTWIVDPNGMWRWKQTGFAGGTYAEFETDMLEKLESAEATH